MAFKQYKGDRMPSALPQKNLEGKLEENLNLTYDDIVDSRINELNKMDEFDFAPGETKQDWMKKRMDHSIDSLNAQAQAHYKDLQRLYQEGKISGPDAKKRRANINYKFGKQDKYLAEDK